MAMKPAPGDDPHAGDRVLDRDTAIVDEAAAALRSYTDHGWAGASRRILDHVLAATRRSRPVRAVGAAGAFHVSDLVVTMQLTAAIDELPGAHLTHVRLDLDEDLLTSVTVGVGVDYPQRIHPLAAEVRRRVVDRLRDVLGPVRPPVGPAEVTVHVNDVTQG